MWRPRSNLERSLENIRFAKQGTLPVYVPQQAQYNLYRTGIWQAPVQQWQTPDSDTNLYQEDLEEGEIPQPQKPAKPKAAKKSTPAAPKTQKPAEPKSQPNKKVKHVETPAEVQKTENLPEREPAPSPAESAPELPKNDNAEAPDEKK